MNISFDAKRAFHNDTGLGNYSRTLIHSLSLYYPQHQYYLFNPKKSTRYSFAQNNVHEILPQLFFDKMFSAAWRSSRVKNDIAKLNIDLYHGLSHEIPVGIERSNVKSIVTIHDLIFERYPEQFSKIDVKIYHAKFLNACRNAHKIIAISEQTKQDIIDFYNIAPSKIAVCYQSCDAIFSQQVLPATLAQVQQKYSLPKQYFLSVGSIIERKNLLNICKAIHQLKDRFNIPLIVIGKGKNAYKKEVDAYIRQHQLEKHVIFLSDIFEGKYSIWQDLPAIYKLSKGLVYPSIFEGFGIPVLEALTVGAPVITSNLSCLPEAGGDGAFYVNPNEAENIAEAMTTVLQNQDIVEKKRIDGKMYATKFSPFNCACEVMNVYEEVMRY